MPYIEFLRESKGVEEEVRLHVEHGEFKGALQVVRTASSRLSRKLQEASLFIDVMDGLKLRQVYAHFLAHYNFMLAYLSLSLGRIFNAEEYLDAAGFCALVTKDNDDIVKASYIKSLLYFNLEEFGEAREQFSTTERLARTLGMHETEFWAVFGKTISMYLSGDIDGAEVSMVDVHNMVEEFGREATQTLLSFADHLQNFGRAVVAIAVYNDALESALEWGQTDMIKKITKAMKHCTATLAHVGAVLDSDLSHLIDKAHDLCNECQEAYFKEVQDIVKEEAEILKPLEATVKEWTLGKDLPDIYREWMEVVRFVPMRELSDKDTIKHTLVLGYVPEVGNLGIYLEGAQEHTNLERYMVRLGDEGVFKVLDAPEHYKRRYGVRGVVGVKDSNQIMFKHLMSASLLNEELEEHPG
jgi:tetratricopeptide (TPR) repeat protein